MRFPGRRGGQRGSGFPSAPGSRCPGEDGVKPFPPRWEKCRQQKAGGESGQVRTSLPKRGWGQHRAGAGAACGEGRWQGGRARRCGAASGTRPRVWRLAGPLGPESGSRGRRGVRRGDCVGLGSASMALCASFLAQGWGQHRPHASPGPCSAGGVAVLPGAPVPLLPTGPFACPAIPQPSCPTSPCPTGLGSWDVGCRCWLLPRAPLAVRRAGVELLGPAGDAGSRRGRAGDDGAGGAGLAAGEPSTGSTQPRHPGGCRAGCDTRLLQRTYGWTVTVLLRGHTVLYDREEDEETQARQRAQR